MNEYEKGWHAAKADEAEFDRDTVRSITQEVPREMSMFFMGYRAYARTLINS